MKSFELKDDFWGIAIIILCGIALLNINGCTQIKAHRYFNGVCKGMDNYERVKNHKRISPFLDGYVDGWKIAEMPDDLQRIIDTMEKSNRKIKAENEKIFR